MANARCREGTHRYELISGTSAGIQRQKCTFCGSVMIDLTGDSNLEVAAGLFAARRATVFSLSTDSETSQDSQHSSGQHSFGQHSFGRPRPRR